MFLTECIELATVKMSSQPLLDVIRLVVKKLNIGAQASSGLGSVLSQLKFKVSRLIHKLADTYINHTSL